MKNILIVLMLFITGSTQAQGINFLKLKDWKAVLELAKKEKKYVFVDFYATWCGPCKAMDIDVYPSPLLKPIFDQKYISIKVQTDQTDKDDDHTKQWYADAKMLRQAQSITSLPTILVFSADGKPVHRQSGFMAINQLKEFAEMATNPRGSYEAMLKKYEQGLITESEDLRILALRAKKLNYTDFANSIASEYITVYLDKINPDKATVEQILFLFEFPQVITAKGQWFKYINANPQAVDKITKLNGGAIKLADYIITKQYIYPLIYQRPNDNNKPLVTKQTWIDIDRKLTKEYGKERSNKLVPASKISYYTQTGNWEQLIRANIENVRKNGLDTSGVGAARINNIVYNVIFKHTDKKKFLKQGLKWMKLICKSPNVTPMMIDTYANLLYKLGRNDEAIQEQQRAIDLAPSSKFKGDLPELRFNFDKMKRGEPTWPVDSLITKQPL